MTVSSPSGRSRSIPLRLFWRAPRISTQPRSGGAVTHGFSAVVEPTGDYPIGGTRLQIFGTENRVIPGLAWRAGGPLSCNFGFRQRQRRPIDAGALFRGSD